MSNAMYDSRRKTEADALREQFLSDAEELSPAIVKAVESIISAVDYNDQTLIQSSKRRFLEALRELLEDAIGKAIARSQKMRESWPKLCDQIRAYVDESTDEVGQMAMGAFDSVVGDLNSFGEAALALTERDCPIEAYERLQRELEEAKKLKARVRENWPWSDKPLPPVDRGMVSRARARLKEGKRGQNLDDLINDLGGQ